MNKQIFFLAIILTIFTACETVVKIDLPEHVSQLVAEAYFSPEDTVLSVVLMHSQGIGSDHGLELIDYANISLLEEGQEVATFEFIKNINADTLYNQDSTFFTFQIGLPEKVALYQSIGYDFKEGKTYQLSIKADGYEDIIASQELLSEPNITNVKYTRLGGTDIDGEKLDEASFTFQNNASGDNYYLFNAFILNHDEGYTSHLYSSSNNPLFSQGRNGTILFDSKSLGGGTITGSLLFWTSGLDTTNQDIILQVLTISQDRYFYEKSMFNISNSDDFFSEPIIVKSNFENGIGLFSIEREKWYVAEF